MQDRVLLNEAVRQQRYWDVVYYARRLMAADSRDPDSLAALLDLPGRELTYRDAVSGEPKMNPLLGPMDPQSRFDLIRSSEIVERETDQILFSVGDAGDAMFVVVRGETGASFAPGAEAFADEARRIRIGVGEIVGELAFALRRRRTATLRCLAPTALLSFNPRAVEAMAGRSPSGPAVRRGLAQFAMARTLEHLCNNLDCLIGRGRSGPLREIDQPWLRLGEYAALLERPGGSGSIVWAQEQDFQRPGLYVLVSGELRETARPGRILDGTRLPIVYADFPGAEPDGPRSFDVASDAVIVRIAAEAFADPVIARNTAEHVVEAVRAAFAEQEAKAAASTGPA